MQKFGSESLKFNPGINDMMAFIKKRVGCGLTSFGPLMVSWGHVTNFRVS
jgi:hypothetical protein